jgi:DNA-binding transcriptional LysR family regulator
MPLLLDLAGRFPALELNVSFTDGQVDVIVEGIDLVVRIGTLDDTPDLIVRSLGVQRLVICGTPAYLAARGTPLSASHRRLAARAQCGLAIETGGRLHRSPYHSCQARDWRLRDAADGRQGGTRHCATSSLVGGR